jgi:hypothetical protein
MGKKAKEHRKKVQARNERIKAEQKKMQKMYQEMFEKKMIEFQNKFSGETVDGERLSVNVNGGEVPFEIINPNELENKLESTEEN